MDSHELELSLKYLASTGQTLTVQEVAGLAAAFTKVKHAEAFEQMFFWGKLLGLDADYLVAYGLRTKGGEVARPQKKFYWCTTETFEFTEMPVVTAEDKAVVAGVRGRLQGAPEKDLTGGEEAEAEEGSPEKHIVREAQRVAVLVEAIDQDTAAVPSGAYALSEKHEVQPSLGFKGLSWDDATDLRNYVHFRAAQDLAALRVTARDDVEFHGNFLDSLAQDIPQGCWVSRVDAACNYVHFRSLLWPGYIAYHVPETRFFGGMYIGTGDKCIDLPFLM